MSPTRIALLGALTIASLLSAQSPVGTVSGTVSGTVMDSQTGRPLAGVRVAVNGQSDERQQTDLDGRYTLSLAPGTYTLGFTAVNYLDVAIAKVEVKAGAGQEVSTVMANRSLVTSVEVVEKATAAGATAEAMLAERKLSASVSDSIGREELSNGAASNAAGALEKVTGVSVVSDGFVYVRGLGERYSSTMLNGALMPTTEPEKRVVPLDLFPAGMIENIRILKTYTPDLPAEFGGGLVQMSTIEFPAEKIFQLSLKSGFNTATTFKPFLGYPGGSTDFFGFDNGSRSIPTAIPTDRRLFPGSFSPTELQSFGRAFSNNWEPVSKSSQRPAADWSMVGGGTFGRFGVVGALSFSNSPQRQSEYQRYFRQGGDGPTPFTEYPDYTEYGESARLGGVLNAAMRINPNNKIVFRNTLTHDTDKTAREFAGYDGGVDGTISSQRLHWVERSLFASSLEGDHSLPSLRNSLVRWQFTYSRSRRDEPDMREVFRGQLPDQSFLFSALGSSGVRFFSNLQDRIYEPQADYSVPFFKGKVAGLWKSGFRGTVRSRDFQARRFRYIPQRLTTLDLFLPSNALFAPSNIRPDGFQLIEFTRGTDAYEANMSIYAGYSMVDIGLGTRWRIVGGIRFESADLRVVTVDNRVPNAEPTTAQLQNFDPTPGVNLIYALTPRQNLRLSFSRTLSRPDFRELSPFDFNNVLGGFVVQGNANLKRATINNYDARWESFPGGNQVIAASFFAKTFTDPIEQTILPSNDLRQTFVNAKGARNIGFELEFRKGLGSISRRMKSFSVSSNFTFVDSNIQIRPEDTGVVTSPNRPLLGQSRFIYNVTGEWWKPRLRSEARFYANHVSRRISGVGAFRLPDIYQEANTFLDFVYQFSFDERGKVRLRFDAENLGDNRFRWTQNDLTQRQYQLGRTFQVGLTYRFF